MDDITTVDDSEEYEKRLVEFKGNLKLFYSHGAKSYFSKKTLGDNETFYVHAQHFYITPILDDT